MVVRPGHVLRCDLGQRRKGSAADVQIRQLLVDELVTLDPSQERVVVLGFDRLRLPDQPVVVLIGVFPDFDAPGIAWQNKDLLVQPRVGGQRHRQAAQDQGYLPGVGIAADRPLGRLRPDRYGREIILAEIQFDRPVPNAQDQPVQVPAQLRLDIGAAEQARDPVIHPVRIETQPLFTHRIGQLENGILVCLVLQQDRCRRRWHLDRSVVAAELDQNRLIGRLDRYDGLILVLGLIVVGPMHLQPEKVVPRIQVLICQRRRAGIAFIRIDDFVLEIHCDQAQIAIDGQVGFGCSPQFGFGPTLADPREFQLGHLLDADSGFGAEESGVDQTRIFRRTDMAAP